MLHDYESLWAYDLQPHAERASYWAQVMPYYRALRSLGLDVDIRHPDSDLSPYRLIVAPALTLLSLETAKKLETAASGGAHLVLGPRSGFRQPSGQVWQNGSPGPLEAAAGVHVSNFDALAPAMVTQIGYAGETLQATTWAEAYRATRPDVTPLAHYTDSPLEGAAAATRAPFGQGSVSTVGAWSDALIQGVLSEALTQAGIPSQVLPEGVRMTRRGKVIFVQNWGQETATISLPPGAKLLSGKLALEPVTTTIFQEDASSFNQTVE